MSPVADCRRTGPHPYVCVHAREAFRRAGVLRVNDIEELFAAAETLRQAIGTPLVPFEKAGREQDLAAVRSALGEAAFAAALREVLGTGRVVPHVADKPYHEARAVDEAEARVMARDPIRDPTQGVAEWRGHERKLLE